MDFQPLEPWFTLPWTVVLCHFPAHPKPQLIISIQVVRRLRPLVTLSQTILPPGVPSSLLPSEPCRSEPLPPSVRRDLPLLHAVRPSWEVSRSPTGHLGASHSGINMRHSLPGPGLTESASQAQFRSQVKATSYGVTWFTRHAVLARGSCTSFSILPLLPQLCALHSGRHARHWLLWWLRQ